MTDEYFKEVAREILGVDVGFTLRPSDTDLLSAIEMRLRKVSNDTKIVCMEARAIIPHDVDISTYWPEDAFRLGQEIHAKECMKV